MLKGEAALRAHLPDDVAMNPICYFDHFNEQWFVKVKMWPHEGAPAVELGPELLEEFPSELMIAQAMLVA